MSKRAEIGNVWGLEFLSSLGDVGGRMPLQLEPRCLHAPRGAVHRCDGS